MDVTIMVKKLGNVWKLSEKEIERSILQYLSVRGDIEVWKVNTIGVFDPITKKFRRPNSPFIRKGISDILGIILGGRFLAIEVKTPQRRNQLSPEQLCFITMINNMGGLAFVATSIEDVKGKLNG